MALRRIPIRRSTHRPNLFMGGDRELVMLSGVLAAALIFSLQDLRAAIIGVLLWVAALFLLRLMARSAPALRGVYLRHNAYQTYYPPRSTPFRRDPSGRGDV